MRPSLLLFFLCATSAVAQVRGVVADVRGGEKLERASVRVESAEAITDSQGRFSFDNIPPGEHELIVSLVGYRLFREKITIRAGEPLELEVALSPEAFTQRESIEVKGNVFDPIEPIAPSEKTLTNSEVKNLGSVLADDPLRAVQAMPGVTADDDFESRFALRGAPFKNIGIYFDDMLLHQPFHTVHSVSTGSLTTLNGDLVDSLSLLTGGFSARYGDRTAGVLAIHSREGGRQRPTARITASASNAGVLAEGPIGSAHKGSWVAAFRKSYLDYIIRRTSDQQSFAFGFTDGQARAVYDLTPQTQISFEAASGNSGLDRSSFRSKIGNNSVMTSDSWVTMGVLGLRYASGPRFLLTTHVGMVRESYSDQNPVSVSLESGRYRETTARADATFYWATGQALEIGGDFRRPDDEGVRTQFASNRYSEWDRFRGNSWMSGGYAQQTWTYHRVRVGAGLRWDRFAPDQIARRENTLTPRLSAVLPLPWNQSLHFGWGQYTQFPEQEWLIGKAGNPTLTAERSTHYLAAWEWQLQERTRFRIEAYDREDRNGIWQPLSDPRLLPNNKILPLTLASPFQNSLLGYARGVEMVLQRRSANRLTGWISYAYGRTHMRDTITGLRFVSDYDQAHTFNAYASYRLRPSVNLSAKWLVGSGFPVPEFLRQSGANYFLTTNRNLLRMDPYQRLDCRINKTFHTARRRFTLYGEVINVLDRRNLRFSELSSFIGSNGQAFPTFDRMFPIIPSAGMVFEF